MGITSSMYIALTGMNMSQAGMEVASHNIANVNTPGYSRQRLNLETTPTWKGAAWGQMGTGVTAQNISRFHDEFLARSIVTKTSQYSGASAKKAAIDAVEAFFNESDGSGINQAMSDFFAAWDSVADAAELNPTREELVSLAKTLADQIKLRRQDLDSVRQDLNMRLDSAVKDVNTVIKDIAQINQQIMVGEDQSRNQQANDLRDTRDALMTQLATLIDVDYWEDPTNGAFNVSFKNGQPLVTNTSYYEVGTETDESGDLHVIANNRRTQPPWPQDVTNQITGGAIGGWIDFRDNEMRELYLQYESFVDELTFRVNNQHAQGVGQDLYTDTTGSSLISNLPSTVFSFDGADNDLKLTALVPHMDYKEPYNAQNDPENIAVRFAKSNPNTTSKITSSVAWNDGTQKWDITITLPTDSNGNVTVTSEDVIRHINNERTATLSGTATLPPQGGTWPYQVGDFLSAQAAAGNNWTGPINFSGASYPSGQNRYQALDRSLANVTGQGRHLSYGSEYATLTTSLKHTGNDILFTALKAGAEGEKIAIEYAAQSGPNQPLSVNVYTDVVTGAKRVSVNLATDENGNISTTAGDIVDLIKRDPQTRDLITAETPQDQDGTGLVKVMDATYLDRSGSFEIVVFDKSGDPVASSRYKITVDPTDTLKDIVSRIGTTFGEGVPGIRAEVITDENGQDRLRIIANTDGKMEYGFRNDTSGALAVLGINNIFTGDSSNNIGVNQQIMDNPRLLAAGIITTDGAVKSDGPMTAGSNENALNMASLKDQRFSFYHLSSATLDTAFNTFYANIGSYNRQVTNDHDFLYGVMEQLQNQQDSLAGVNLDEELADVLRYQYMYQASAKMISTIDDMMNTLLAIR